MTLDTATTPLPTLNLDAATETEIGGLTEAPSDGTPYARQDAAWVPSVGTPLEDGVGITIDDAVTPNVINLDPATPTEIRGITEPTTPQVRHNRVWDGTVGRWEPTTDLDSILYAGVGLSKTGQTVDLQPPGADHTDPTRIGGVRSPPRGPDQGLQLDGDGLLTAPLATFDDAGVLREPPVDGLSYARRYNSTLAPPSWVWEPTVTPGLQITGLIPNKVMIDPTAPDLLVNAYGSEFTSTCVLLFDGVAVPTQFESETHLTTTVNPDVAPGVARIQTVTVQDTATAEIGAGAEAFEFVEQAASVLSLEFIIPNEMVFGPGEILVVEAHGAHFTPTTEVIWDVTPVPTTYVSPTEMTFEVDPNLQVIAGPVPVTVQDAGAAGLGDATFTFRTARVAGHAPEETGVVYVPARSQGQGLALGADGMLRAPLATDQHAGAILEPQEVDKRHVRVRDGVTGVSRWEEEAAGFEEPPMLPVALWGRSNGGDRGWLPIPEPPPGMEEPPVSPVALWGRTSAGVRGWAEVPTFDHLTGFVEKIGDTMQGFLTLHADPENPFHAATRNWVELELQLKVDEPPNDDVAYARKWKEWVKVEDAQGMEEPPAEPVALWSRSSAGARGWLEAPTFEHLDGKVDKFGDTMTGKLTLDGPPVNPLHAATKDYVDLSEPQEAPHNGKAYARQDGQWVEVEEAQGGIGEPPANPVAVWGRTSDRGWAEVPTFDHLTGFVDKIGDTMTGALNLRDDKGGLFIPNQPAHAINLDFAELTYLKDAPTDGKQYVREEGKWVEAAPSDSGIEEPPMNPVAVWGRTLIAAGRRFRPSMTLTAS